MSHSVEEVEALGGYKILYADAAWKYRNNGRGAAANHYLTTPDAELAALPVSRLAACNSVIFMWMTWPTLPVGLATMAAWGFEFKTLGFIWVKHHEKSGKPFWGGGFWSRANTEACFIGVRGNSRRIGAGVHQLVETWDEQEDLVLRAPHPKNDDGSKRHSAKPSEVRERIVQLMGDLPRIELFARERALGWDAYGNEIESDITMTATPSPAIVSAR